MMLEHASLDIDRVCLYTDSDCDIGFYQSYDPRVVRMERFVLRGQVGFAVSMVIDLSQGG